MSNSVHNFSACRKSSDFLKTIAFNILEPSAFDRLKNYTIDSITDAIYDQYYGERFPQVLKCDSEVKIDLAEEELLKTSKLQSPTDIWIFGYGSLIWKVDFPYIQRKAGYINGYERKFYQNSIDHRGLPEKPGRVVTLIPSGERNAKVWGVGYRISSRVKYSVVQNLDIREKNGYDRLPVLFYPYPEKKRTKNDEPIEMLAYVANEKNSSYAGHIDDLDEIVEQIFEAVGPSGPNREYVYKLANAMRELFPGQIDQHLFDLESKLRAKEEEHLDIIGKVKNNIKDILERGCLEYTPIGDLRLKLKNLDLLNT